MTFSSKTPIVQVVLLVLRGQKPSRSVLLLLLLPFSSPTSSLTFDHRWIELGAAEFPSRRTNRRSFLSAQNRYRRRRHRENDAEVAPTGNDDAPIRLAGLLLHLRHRVAEFLDE